MIPLEWLIIFYNKCQSGMASPLKVDRHSTFLNHLGTMATTSNGAPRPPATADVEDDAPPAGWGTDDRISFSKETRKYLQTNDDGSEMEYNSKYKAWMPVVHIPICIQYLVHRFMATN